MCTRGVRCLGGVNFHPDAVHSPAQLCRRLDLAGLGPGLCPLRAAAPRRWARRLSGGEGWGGALPAASVGARRVGLRRVPDYWGTLRRGRRRRATAVPGFEALPAGGRPSRRDASPSRRCEPGARLLGYAAPWSESACGLSAGRVCFYITCQYNTGYSVGNLGSPHDVTPLRPSE